jgi:hypothetical protein
LGVGGGVRGAGDRDAKSQESANEASEASVGSGSGMPTALLTA